MSIVRSVLPHIVIILSGIFLVFLLLDSYNPTMNFTGNEVSMKLFQLYCILSLLNSIIIIAFNRRAHLYHQDNKNN